MTKAGTKAKIAIANTDKGDADVVKEVLTRDGYEIFHNEASDIGITEIEKEKPDLLILGMRPGDHASLGLLDIIHAKGITLPILVITTPDLVTDNLSQKGIAGLLLKPVDKGRLSAHVRSILDIQQGAGGGTAKTQAIPVSPTYDEFMPEGKGELPPENLEEAFKRRKDRGKNPLILIVDDEPDMQTLLTDLLGFNGFDVVTASDGVQGMAMAQQLMPNAILLDIMLPKLDGYQVCRLLKYNEKFRGIPIIMVSARNHPKDKELADGSGANGYVMKPFETEDLISVIKKATTQEG